MNISQQPLDAASLRLTVTVDEADYLPEAEKKIREYGRNHVLPGFRKGHVPFAELRRRIGKEVTSDVVNDVVREAVFKYIDDEKIDALGYPLPVERKELAMSGEQQFQFDVALLPALAQAVDKEQKFPYYEIEVSDTMIDEQDKAMRKRAGKQQPGQEMQDDALVKGAIMQLDAEGNVNKNPGAIQMTNGIVFPLYFKDQEEAKKFEGTKVGDRVVFNPYRASGGNEGEIASMLGIDKEIARDMKDDFEMTIAEYMHNIPAELTQEYYDQVFGKDKIHNEQEYRDAVKQIIAAQLVQESNQLFRFTFDNRMDQENKDMPMAAALLERLFFAKAEDPAAAYASEKDAVRRELVKLRLMQNFDVKVTEDELLAVTRAMVEQQFAQFGMSGVPDDVVDKYAKEQLKDNEKREGISHRIADNKLYAAVREAVTLEKEAVSLEKFQELAQAQLGKPAEADAAAE